MTKDLNKEQIKAKYFWQQPSRGMHTLAESGGSVLYRGQETVRLGVKLAEGSKVTFHHCWSISSDNGQGQIKSIKGSWAAAHMMSRQKETELIGAS